jgi:hypothetical protein
VRDVVSPDLGVQVQGRLAVAVSAGLPTGQGSDCRASFAFWEADWQPLGRRIEVTQHLDEPVADLEIFLCRPVGLRCRQFFK